MTAKEREAAWLAQYAEAEQAALDATGGVLACSPAIAAALDAERHRFRTEKSDWVIVFDCDEAAIVQGVSEEQAWQVTDPLDCRPTAVHPLSRCVLKKEPWVKDGLLRCDLAWVNPWSPIS